MLQQRERQKMITLHFLGVVYVALSIGFMSFKAVTTIINIQQRRKQKEITKNYKPFISIIVPVYNENRKDLYACLDSVCNNDYKNKEVFVINDGSTLSTTNQALKEYSANNRNNKRYHYINLINNVGKREAMYKAIIRAKGEYLVVVDSDSVARDGFSLRELVKPFLDKKVDAVSGMTYAANEKHNMLTKMQAGRYALAFEMEKAGQATYGAVTCCPGCYSAYRKSAVMKVLKKWREHSVFGVKTSYGDDRSLTRLILLNGGEVRYSSEAVAFTNVPEKISGFIKQQIRWKRSFFSEHFLLARGWKQLSTIARIELVWFLLVWVGGFGAKATILYKLATGGIGLVAGLSIYLAFSMVHYTYVLVRYAGTTRGLWGGLYGFLNDMTIEWLAFYSLFTLKNNNWGTR